MITVGVTDALRNDLWCADLDSHQKTNVKDTKHKHRNREKDMWNKKNQKNCSAAELC